MSELAILLITIFGCLIMAMWHETLSNSALTFGWIYLLVFAALLWSYIVVEVMRDDES